MAMTTTAEHRIAQIPHDVPRDAVIVMLGVLLLARREGRTVSQLAATLPARFTASDRLKEFPVESSRAILNRFSRPEEAENRRGLDEAFGALVGGRAKGIDRTDGVRVTFDNAEILHFRPSGNAPEFRCYAEADTAARANELCARALAKLRTMV